MRITKTTNKNGDVAVSAKELYEYLEVKSKFATWVKRMFDYGFTDGNDYITNLTHNGVKGNNPFKNITFNDATPIL